MSLLKPFTKIAMLATMLACIPLWATIQSAGNVTTTTVGSDQVDFQLDSGGIARIQMLDSGLVRVRVNSSKTFQPWSTGATSPNGLVPPNSTITDTAAATYIVTSQTVAVILKSPFAVVIFRADGSLVSSDMPQGIGWDPQNGFIYDQKYAPPDEHYFGLGERGGPVDRRGRTITMWNVDWAGYSELSNPLYISIPYFYGLRSGMAWGLFLDSSAMPSFDMDSSKTNVLQISANSNELDYYVMVGPETWRVANTYTRLTGYKPVPPKWTLGYHQSRYGYSSETQILQVAAQLRQQSFPCDSLYFDINYMNNLQMFTWDPTNFGSAQVMNSWLSALGFHTVNIMEPVVRTDDPLWPTLDASSYFLKQADGTSVVTSVWYGNVSFIDFTRNDAVAWYKQALQTFLSNGISATWDDLDEPASNFMPQSIYNFNGTPQPDLVGRDIYALKETAASYAAQQELRPNVRPWVLSRSGFSGIQRYAANWGGDENSTFDSLRVAVEMSASMGISGQDQFGHDIGGFLGSPTAELFIRWLEFSAFTPLFRNHATNTSSPREPWVFGEPYTTIARNYINQRYRMLPYIYTLQFNASYGGTPVVTPLFFWFPGDAQTYTQNSEFMFGNAFLVAPVVTQGATTQSVYLPAGVNWFDYYTDASYPGGQQITAAAPLANIPLYVQAGAIIPGGPLVQYVDQPTAQLMTIDLYPGPNNSFVLYEDDGKSFDYTKGVYLKTLISRTETSTQTLVNLQRTEGTWVPPNRAWTLTFHGSTTAPKSVQINGTTAPAVSSVAALNNVLVGWFFDATSNHLLVRMQDTSTPLQVTVTH